MTGLTNGSNLEGDQKMRGKMYVAYQNCYPVAIGKLAEVEKAVKAAKREYAKNSTAYLRSCLTEFKVVKIR